jgi:AraC-like DNA-binding protein
MKRSKTVQKRSSGLEIVYDPARLDPEFPIRCGGLHRQHDRPITYLHVHNYLEIGYCHEGGGIFMVGGKVLPFRTGDVSFIAAGEVHLARSAPGTTSQWSWIDLDPHLLLGGWVGSRWLETEVFAGPGFHNILAGELRAVAGPLVLDIIGELGKAGPGSDNMIRARVLELMIRIHREGAGKAAARGRRRTAGHFDRLAPALQWMARHYAEPVDIGAAARLCGLSGPHFRRLFRRTVGRSPREYWHDLRLRMAASLLRNSTRSVLDISQDVGFGTVSSFNRLFRAVHGRSPRQWRRRD